VDDREIARRALDFQARARDFRMMELPGYMDWSERKLAAGGAEALIAHLDATSMWLTPEDAEKLTPRTTTRCTASWPHPCPAPMASAACEVSGDLPVLSHRCRSAHRAQPPLLLQNEAAAPPAGGREKAGGELEV